MVTLEYGDNMNKKIIGSIILVILTIVVFYFLVKDNYQEIFNSIINSNIYFLLLGFLLYIAYTILQAVPFYLFTKTHQHNINFSFFIYLIVATNFFNGITPLATGGQPLQVYELHKKKISTLDSTNIVIENFIIFQFSIVLFGIIALFINTFFDLFVVSKVLLNLTIIGFILNVILLLFILLVAFKKDFVEGIIIFIINLLYKLKLVKNKTKQEEKWKKTCTEFYDNFQILFKKKGILLISTIALTIGLLAYYSIPLTIIHALGITANINLITTIVISSYVFLASSYLPIPGSTGGVEYAFIGYFSNYVFNYKVYSLLLVWRFITYYLPMIIGGIVFNIKSIKKSSKN